MLEVLEELGYVRGYSIEPKGATLARIYGESDILVTEAVQKTLDARFIARAMPPVPVKGKSEPVATFAIESFDPTRGRPPEAGSARPEG